MGTLLAVLQPVTKSIPDLNTSSLRNPLVAFRTGGRTHLLSALQKSILARCPVLNMEYVIPLVCIPFSVEQPTVTHLERKWKRGVVSLIIPNRHRAMCIYSHRSPSKRTTTTSCKQELSTQGRLGRRIEPPTTNNVLTRIGSDSVNSSQPSIRTWS